MRCNCTCKARLQSVKLQYNLWSDVASELSVPDVSAQLGWVRLQNPFLSPVLSIFLHSSNDMIVWLITNLILKKMYAIWFSNLLCFPRKICVLSEPLWLLMLTTRLSTTCWKIPMPNSQSLSVSLDRKLFAWAGLGYYLRKISAGEKTT